MPKTALSGTAIAATRRVSPMAEQGVALAERRRRGADALGQRLGEDDDERREEDDRDQRDDDGDEAAAEPARFGRGRAEARPPGRRRRARAYEGDVSHGGPARTRGTGRGRAQRHREGVERRGGHRPLAGVVVVGADRLQRLAVGLGGVAEPGDLGFEHRERRVERRRARALHAAEGGVGLGAQPGLAGRGRGGRGVDRGLGLRRGRRCGRPGGRRGRGWPTGSAGAGGGRGPARSAARRGPCGCQASPNLLRLQTWTRLMTRSIAKEMASMATAMATAPS